MLVFSFIMCCTTEQKFIVIKNVSVIDSINNIPQDNMTIVIEENRIKNLGKTDSIDYPNSALIIDGTGRFLIPGLWDMHVHLYASELSLPLFVLNGVMSVRDMGSDFNKTSKFINKIQRDIG